eukprot:m.35511 g.35511  ORF g.35511 m.35511 type:complete len:83 (+) comp32137_c0_seq1:176-424(+)
MYSRSSLIRTSLVSGVQINVRIREAISSDSSSNLTLSFKLKMTYFGFREAGRPTDMLTVALHFQTRLARALPEWAGAALEQF